MSDTGYAGVDCWTAHPESTLTPLTIDAWRMSDTGYAGVDCWTAHPESTLTPLTIDAWRMLSLLPSPPREDRVHAALGELHELGALTSDDKPSALGTAYLKLPVDV